MTAYIIRRILFMIPTMFGIMLVAFVVVQFAPGGPVEQVIARLTGADTGATSRISGSQSDLGNRGLVQGGSQVDAVSSKYRGAQGLDPEFIKELERQFGFDKPAHERFLLMVWNFVRFDFGKSYFRDAKVIDLIKEKMPVSISLGIWMTLLAYLISIPLGITKAVRDGSRFDVWSSTVVIVGYAVPGFLFGRRHQAISGSAGYFNFYVVESPEVLTSKPYLERLDNPTKHWKFSVADRKMRERWGDFQRAYEEAINHCSTKHAPWHIVPANRKWFRDYVVASTAVKALEQLNLKWPKCQDDVSKVKIK